MCCLPEYLSKVQNITGNYMQMHGLDKSSSKRLMLLQNENIHAAIVPEKKNESDLSIKIIALRENLSRLKIFLSAAMLV